MTVATGSLISASDFSGISSGTKATASGFNTAMTQTLVTAGSLIKPTGSYYYLIKNGARPSPSSWSLYPYGLFIADNVKDKNGVNTVKTWSDGVGYKCAYILVDLTNFKTIHWTKTQYDEGKETIRIYPTTVGDNYNNTQVWDGSWYDGWENGSFSGDISNLTGVYRVGIYITYIHALYISQMYLTA